MGRSFWSLIGNDQYPGALRGKVTVEWAELGNEDGSVPVDMGHRPDTYGANPPMPNASNEYPAVPVDWPKNTINMVNGQYNSSVTIGKDELVAHLNDRYAGNGPENTGSCQNETLVLAGYSQGADVVGWTLQQSGLSQAVKNHIGYVALYGDPKFEAGNWADRFVGIVPWWVRGNDYGWAFTDYRYTGQSYGYSRNGALGARQPYTQSFVNERMGSWCDTGDGVCTGTLITPLNIGTHSNAYQGNNGWIAKSAAEIANRAIDKRNQLNPDSQPVAGPGYTVTRPSAATIAPPKPSIRQVKRTTGPDGVREVYAATLSTVTEAYWYPGGNGVHKSEILHLNGEVIVGFDKVNEPDGIKQSLYAAVPDGVWESYWRPNEGVHSAKIVSGLNGVRQIIAAPRQEAAGYTHRLYVLCNDGPYEIWWRDGDQQNPGIHISRLDIVNNPVAMTKSIGPSGEDQLYVATPTWVYELWWNSDGNVHHSPIINIAQGDIRSLSKGANLPDGGQLLYTATSTAVWQSWWHNCAPVHGTIAAGKANVFQAKKTLMNEVHQIYLATPNTVQEYWWLGANSGNSTLITISQGDITAFDKTNDGIYQQVYTATGNGDVWETYWGGGQGPTSKVLFSVER
jgi:hypothetical protein